MPPARSLFLNVCDHIMILQSGGIKQMLKIGKRSKKVRHWQDSNLRTRRVMDQQSIALTTRPQCLTYCCGIPIVRTVFKLVRVEWYFFPKVFSSTSLSSRLILEYGRLACCLLARGHEKPRFYSYTKDFFKIMLISTSNPSLFHLTHTVASIGQIRTVLILPLT